MMKKKMLDIFTDTSGKSFGYELKDDVDECLMMGDGYDTEKEIKEFWKKVYITLRKADKNGELDY